MTLLDFYELLGELAGTIYTLLYLRLAHVDIGTPPLLSITI